MDDDFEYEVRHRAYELWVAGGRPNGKHQQFWELAERELKIPARKIERLFAKAALPRAEGRSLTPQVNR